MVATKVMPADLIYTQPRRVGDRPYRVTFTDGDSVGIDGDVSDEMYRLRPTDGVGVVFWSFGRYDAILGRTFIGNAGCCDPSYLDSDRFEELTRKYLKSCLDGQVDGFLRQALAVTTITFLFFYSEFGVSRFLNAVDAIQRVGFEDYGGVTPIVWLLPIPAALVAGYIGGASLTPHSPGPDFVENHRALLLDGFATQRVRQGCLFFPLSLPVLLLHEAYHGLRRTRKRARLFTLGVVRALSVDMRSAP